MLNFDWIISAMYILLNRLSRELNPAYAISFIICSYFILLLATERHGIKYSQGIQTSPLTTLTSVVFLTSEIQTDDIASVATAQLLASLLLRGVFGSPD